jgi:hypothetical protein
MLLKAGPYWALLNFTGTQHRYLGNYNTTRLFPHVAVKGTGTQDYNSVFMAWFDRS